MLSVDFVTLLVPFKLMLNKNALSPVYSTIELTPTRMYGCSAYAMMEVHGDIGINKSCFVNAATFITVIDSLPERGDVTLVVTEGSLNWKCGRARGKLALVKLDTEMPKINRRMDKNNAWKVDRLFSKTLQLGAISCDNNSLSSVGMYGIVVDNRKYTTIYSSDNTTVSACRLGEYNVEQMPDMFTLPPEGAMLLAAVCKNGGTAEFSDTDVFYYNEGVKVLIRYSMPLRHDISKILERNLVSEDMVVQLPEGRMEAFMKRVNAIAESQRHATVSLHVKKDRISLSFDEGTAASDEYYVVTGLEPTKGMDAVHMSAAKVARALAHVNTVVLDRLADRVVILRGDAPLYYYIVAGKAINANAPSKVTEAIEP